LDVAGRFLLEELCFMIAVIVVSMELFGSASGYDKPRNKVLKEKRKKKKKFGLIRGGTYSLGTVLAQLVL
jgi:hypothetical protein